MMLNARNEDRKSLFAMLQTDRALAVELLYIESSCRMGLSRFPWRWNH